jgi:hypothetical protein
VTDALIRAVAHTLPRAESDNPHHDPDPRHILADCEDILDAAAAWLSGTLPLTELMRLGTIEDHHGRPSPRYSRWVAMATAERSDPRRRALLAALDRVVAAQVIVTRQGVLTPDEMHQHDAAVRFVLDRAPWEKAA